LELFRNLEETQTADDHIVDVLAHIVDVLVHIVDVLAYIAGQVVLESLDVLE
jgi:hypothetical protein